MFMSGDQDQFDSKNVLTVPLKVVREAALNLLIHRTWWSEGRTPSVNIFDDRVEFMNPGAFPPGAEASSTSSLSARKLGFPNLSMILSRTSFA